MEINSSNYDVRMVGVSQINPPERDGEWEMCSVKVGENGQMPFFGKLNIRLPSFSN